MPNDIQAGASAAHAAGSRPLHAASDRERLDDTGLLQDHDADAAERVLAQLAAVELHFLSLTPDVPHDRALALLQQAEGIKRRASDLWATVHDLALAWAVRNGPLVCGMDVRYEAARQRTVVCRNALKTAEHVLEAVGGDLGGMVAHLRADPWKHGACAATLAADTWASLFEVRFTDHLTLIRVDKRFTGTRGRRSATRRLPHGE